MFRLIGRLFTVNYPYSNPFERQRAAGLLGMSALGFLVWLGWLVMFAAPALAEGTPVTAFLNLAALWVVVTPITVLLTFALVRSGRLKVASWVFILGMLALVLPTTWQQYARQESGLLVSVAFSALTLIPMVAAGLLVRRRDAMVVALILIVNLGVQAGVQREIATPILYAPAVSVGADLLLAVSAVIVALVLVLVFGGTLEQSAGKAFSDARWMRAVAEFDAHTEAREDEDHLLQGAIKVLREHLGYSFSQVFLVDESGRFTRRVRPGLGSRESGVHIALNAAELAVLEDVVRLREPVVVDYQSNRGLYLVAPARRAVAVPIIGDNHLLGIIDVHQRTPGLYDDRDYLILLGQVLGARLAQTRLTLDLRQTLLQQQEAVEHFRGQLRREERLSRSQLPGVLDGQVRPVFGFNLERAGGAPTLIPATDIPARLQPALQSGQVQVETDGDQQIVSVPIIFRGETLGAMSFAVAGDNAVTERQVDLVQKVANRLALALENTRLFQQTQAQATRERKASEVASALIQATDVKTVLDLAAESFHDALGAIYTRVYLQPEFLNEPLAGESRSEN